jgi:hypothetical protein
VCHLPFGSGGRGAHSLAREGVGRVPIPTRDIHSGTLFINKYFVSQINRVILLSSIFVEIKMKRKVEKSWWQQCQTQEDKMEIIG